jgi:hypothetical protein
MEHKITEAECRSKISGVCSRCGGKLEPIDTMDNARSPTFWPGCTKCLTFDYGVDERVYKIAKQLVDEGYRHYHSIEHSLDDNEETRAYKLREQVGGACGVVRRVLWLDKNTKNG